MKIFYTTFICIFFNIYITKAAKQEPFTIDIYLPIFSCLDEFVAGNLFYQKEGEEYGKIWETKGYTEDKNYPSLPAVESGRLIVDTRLGLSRCGKGMSLEEVFLPIYVFKKDNFLIRFFFADTYAYPNLWTNQSRLFFKFVGNINVFCWLGNIKNSGDNNDGAPAPVGSNEGSGKIVVENLEDLEKVVLSKSVDIFHSPGADLKRDDLVVDFSKYKKKVKVKKVMKDPKKLEFDHNIFSFVFLGEDPFSEDYSDVYCKKDRKGLTVEQSEGDNINVKEKYFDYFNSKIKSLFDLNKIQNFLEKQKDFLGNKTGSAAAEDIKKLLDIAFGLLKRYSDEGWETKATDLIEVEVIKEKNCCETCCENICG